MNSPTVLSILQSTLDFAEKDARGKDPSHDFYHIKRVLRLATTIANKECAKNIELIQLAAILHDVGDYKYSTEKPEDILRKFFQEQNYPQEQAEFVISIVSQIGFSKRISGNEQEKVLPEVAIVSDADMLDAIGAFGIARTFSYGASKGSPIYDPDQPYRTEFTQEQYQKKDKAPTINHFYEKLLKLSDLIYTQTGKEMAKERHKFMESFVEQMHKEYECYY